ncbi:MAG: helix-turn-helix transcriptional regulator [Sandaracinus sp.]
MATKRGATPMDPATRAIQVGVGARIRSRRLRAKLSQEQVAHDAEMDSKRFQRLELGMVNATINTLARVARALGTDYWTLLGARPPARMSRAPR